MAISNLRKSIFYLQESIRHDSDLDSDDDKLFQVLNLLVEVELSKKSDETEELQKETRGTEEGEA